MATEEEIKERIRKQGGGVIFHFARRRTHMPTCFYCPTISTHQCDFMEGSRVCSRYLCPKHRNFVGPGVDFCEPHMSVHRQRINRERATHGN